MILIKCIIYKVTNKSQSNMRETAKKFFFAKHNIVKGKNILTFVTPQPVTVPVPTWTSASVGCKGILFILFPNFKGLSNW